MRWQMESKRMANNRLEFGIFLAPFHPVNENPTLSL